MFMKSGLGRDLLASTNGNSGSQDSTLAVFAAAAEAKYAGAFAPGPVKAYRLACSPSPPESLESKIDILRLKNKPQS